MPLALVQVATIYPLTFVGNLATLTPGDLSLFRPLLTISAVAAISCCIAHFERAQGQQSTTSTWVRTVDGWEPSGVLDVEPRPSEAINLHPALVASFQLGASLFALLAFPSQKPSAKQSARVSSVRVSRRPRRQQQVAMDS